jgi:uncharacterized membrane protein
VPHGTGWEAVRSVVPVFLAYVLRFAFLGIYWNNHHHMLQITDRIGGSALWANLHLLFWLSLVPFVTRWMGESHFAPLQVAAYGGVALMAGVAWLILQACLLTLQGPNSRLAAALIACWAAACEHPSRTWTTVRP